MKKRTLGKSDLRVAPLALGGNVFGWTIQKDQSFQVLDAFVDLGLNLVDTANVYSAWVPGNVGGESETIIGEWLKASGKRNKIVLATKVGHQMGDGSKGLKKNYILKSVEDSLKRLQSDVIDLYQSHVDDESTPVEETLEAYATLLKQGKIRAIGASNFTAKRLAQAMMIAKEAKLPIYATLQPEYNLYDRAGFEKELEPLCLQEGIGVIGYYSLASGFLTGKYRSKADLSKSQRGSSIGTKYLNERGLTILAALDQVSEAQKVAPGVAALAWLIQRPAVVAPIASATSVDQLNELAQATQIQLSDSEVKLLDRASAL